MARVTIEDCIAQVNNRFEIVLLATKRARDISAGANVTIPRDNDKNSVIALREVAKNTISLDDIRKNLVISLQKTLFADDIIHN